MRAAFWGSALGGEDWLLGRLSPLGGAVSPVGGEERLLGRLSPLGGAVSPQGGEERLLGRFSPLGGAVSPVGGEERLLGRFSPLGGAVSPVGGEERLLGRFSPLGGAVSPVGGKSGFWGGSPTGRARSAQGFLGLGWEGWTVKRWVLMALLNGVVWGQPVLTPRALIESERPTGCAMSPDGKYLVVEVAQPAIQANRQFGEMRIYALGGAKPLATFKNAGGARWSPDSKQLLCQRAGGVWVCATGKWDWRRVGKIEPDEVIWGTDSRSLVYSAPVGAGFKGPRVYDDLFERRWSEWWDGRRRHLFVSDLAGRSRDVTPGPADAVATSGAFSSGDGFAVAGNSLFYSAPPRRGQAYDTNYDVFLVDLKTGERINLTRDNPAADMGPRVWDGRLYIVSSARPGYESDFPQVRSCPLTALGQWRDEKLGDELGELTPSTSGWLMTRTTAGVTRGYAGERLLHHQGSIRSLTGGAGKWAGIESSFTLPPQVVWGDVAGKTLALGERPAWKLGEVEKLQVSVEGGRSMDMWLFKPPGYRPERRWPLVVLVHGGPQGGWGEGWSYRWNPQIWAARGYLVLMPNPRGSSGYGREFQEQVSRDWGGRAYRDLMAGMDMVAARPDVDVTRLAAAGASYGGYMVNWFSVNTGRFKALVTHCGIWNMESMYGATDELWFTDWEFGGPPWSAPEDYARFSPHKFAAKLGEFKTPHLVVHNDRDFRCPLDQGLQLFTALQRQGVPSRLVNFPDEGHWVVKPANSLHWHQEVLDWVERYCPAGAAK